MPSSAYELRIRILLAFVWLMPAIFSRRKLYRPAAVLPPQPAREFRGAWLVTVARQGLAFRARSSRRGAKGGIDPLLDRAVQLNLNAIIFQVRPSCDALYASSIEPWSEYLTGTMGEAPQPFFDPLAFAIEEAHKRGLELHAWFNPFRALHPQANRPSRRITLSRTHPELVRKYGSQLWLDPGEPSARDYVLRVVMDVVRRYDVDGVQLTIIFIPTRKRTRRGANWIFPTTRAGRNTGCAAE